MLRSRRIDDGRPLILPVPPGLGAFDALAVYAAVCGNPECLCDEMDLDVRPGARVGESTFEFDGVLGGGEASSSGEDVSLDAEALGAPVAQWLAARLAEEGNREWLRERWTRLRAQVGDPRYGTPTLPEDLTWLIPLHDVFPGEFDLTCAARGAMYLAEDSYCLRPGCTCDDVTVEFIELSSPGSPKPLGPARASIRRLDKFRTGDPQLRDLWAALLQQHGSGKLRERFARMRQVARQRLVPEPVSSSPASVGRNEPCPCGSGKKFKRCCAV